MPLVLRHCRFGTLNRDRYRLLREIPIGPNPEPYFATLVRELPAEFDSRRSALKLADVPGPVAYVRQQIPPRTIRGDHVVANMARGRTLV